jgi:hypothetical protein
MATTKPKKKAETKSKLTSSARFYPTKWGFDAPSVTTILSGTESRAAQTRLENWSEKWKADPENEGKTEPKDRGSLIDDRLSKYFALDPESRVLPTSWGLPEDVKPFMDAILKPIKATGKSILAQITDVIWSQGLLDCVDIPRSERQFYHPDIKIAKEQEFISSKTHRYAGVPDFVGNYTNAKGETKLSLISLKTSDKNYSKVSPDWKAFNARLAECRAQGIEFAPPEGWRENYGANMKFRRAGMQESAYDLALQESLGIYVEQYIVLVVTAKGIQTLSINGMEKDWFNRMWLEKVEKFYEMYPELSAS